MIWNGTLINVTPANFIHAEVVQTDPGLKGDTATGGTKPATIITGATINVPLFIEQGESIKIDTRGWFLHFSRQILSRSD